MSPHPWYRRFLDNPPIVSDRAWALTLMAVLVGMGIAIGVMLCSTGHVQQSAEHTRTAVEGSVVRLRLDTLEHRIKALEDR
jgi:hypothetical protein